MEELVVIGLGVSSIRLLKMLEADGKEFKVIAPKEFGIWTQMAEHGENFDLVTTIESTNFSDWAFDYEFPFLNAKEYFEMLKREVTPYIHSRKIDSHVKRVEHVGGVYHLFADDNREIVKCKHLVCSLGFQPDTNIPANMKLSSEIRDSKVLINCFSDTANMYIARLMLNNNTVVVASDHFTTLDKMSDLGLRNKDGSVAWVPFDQTEPFQYLLDNNEFWHDSTLWLQLLAPVYHSTLLGDAWRKVLGLSELLDFSAYKKSLPGNSIRSLICRKGISSGMFLPIKYWPVDAYFDHYQKHSDHMLSNKIYLNDIWFFIMLGRVKVVPRSGMTKLEDGTYQLPDGTNYKPDVVMQSERAKHRTLKIEHKDGLHDEYAYDKYLYGLWHKSHENLYYLGTTRPTTGAFGCCAEISNMFVYKMVTDDDFRSRMVRECDGHFDDWRRNWVHGQRCIRSIQETDWSGQFCERLARLMGSTLTLRTAVTSGLWDAYFAGPGNMLRYTIDGPFAKEGSKEKYKKQCDSISGPDSKRIQFEILFGHTFCVHLVLVVLGFFDWYVAAAFAGICCLPVKKKPVYSWLKRALYVHMVPFMSYAGNYNVLRTTWPLLLLVSAWNVHAWLAGAFFILALPLWITGVFKCDLSIAFGLGFSIFAAQQSLWVSTSNPYAVATLRSGVPLFVTSVTVEAFYLLFGGAKRLIFNDCRPKKSYITFFQSYVDDYRAFVQKPVK
eukprot:TRINITY_DN30078_c0_g1_i1.p1 TRINITY_DN30078_c0_g1~~TRINITY_DN30078_c0_g1_i1.p1  ORF type:complete len:723 (+),score=87.46 TRINITY_DN30078_c0_g1_i1:244-2412(+)